MAKIHLTLYTLVYCVVLISSSISHAQTTDIVPDASLTLESGNIQSVAIIVAMQAEANPIIGSLDLHAVGRFDNALPMERYEGKVGNLDVVLVINGPDPQYGIDSVGTQLAAINTLMTIQNYEPDLLINVGTAGGFSSKGGSIGDIYLATGFKYHDRRIPIPGYDLYGIGSYSAVEASQLADYLDVKLGIVSTGDSFAMTQADATAMIANQAVAKEMEAAGIAQVASLYHTPMIALKGIVDIVDDEGSEAKSTDQQFEENFESVVETLQEKLVATLDYLQHAQNEG